MSRLEKRMFPSRGVIHSASLTPRGPFKENNCWNHLFSTAQFISPPKKPDQRKKIPHFNCLNCTCVTYPLRGPINIHGLGLGLELGKRQSYPRSEDRHLFGIWGGGPDGFLLMASAKESPPGIPSLQTEGLESRPGLSIGGILSRD